MHTCMYRGRGDTEGMLRKSNWITLKTSPHFKSRSLKAFYLLKYIFFLAIVSAWLLFGTKEMFCRCEAETWQQTKLGAYSSAGNLQIYSPCQLSSNQIKINLLRIRWTWCSKTKWWIGTCKWRKISLLQLLTCDDTIVILGWGKEGDYMPIDTQAVTIDQNDSCINCRKWAVIRTIWGTKPQA